MTTEELKQQWKADPCWDIETTEGFEKQHAELYIFRLECELAWEREQLREVRSALRALKLVLERA